MRQFRFLDQTKLQRLDPSDRYQYMVTSGMYPKLSNFEQEPVLCDGHLHRQTIRSLLSHHFGAPITMSSIVLPELDHQVF
jgi:hypothetical protein